MKSMNELLAPIRDALVSVMGTSCYHYWRASQDLPYCIWAEDSEADSYEADNHKQEQAVTGSVDYFSKDEFDSNVDAIQDALNGIDGLSWRLNSVQHEAETGINHYEWYWTVI